MKGLGEENVSSLVGGVLSILNRNALEQKSEIAKQRIEQYRSSQVIPQFEQLYEEATL